MKKVEYSVILKSRVDGEKIANFVGIEIMASMGLIKQEVKNFVHHFVYEGAYTTADERVACRWLLITYQTFF